MAGIISHSHFRNTPAYTPTILKAITETVTGSGAEVAEDVAASGTGVPSLASLPSGLTIKNFVSGIATDTS